MPSIHEILPRNDRHLFRCPDHGGQCLKACRAPIACALIDTARVCPLGESERLMAMLDASGLPSASMEPPGPSWDECSKTWPVANPSAGHALHPTQPVRLEGPWSVRPDGVFENAEGGRVVPSGHTIYVVEALTVLLDPEPSEGDTTAAGVAAALNEAAPDDVTFTAEDEPFPAAPLHPEPLEEDLAMVDRRPILAALRASGVRIGKHGTMSLEPEHIGRLATAVIAAFGVEAGELDDEPEQPAVLGAHVGGGQHIAVGSRRDTGPPTGNGRPGCPSCGLQPEDFAEGGGPCCNAACGGKWGTGCYHCHHPRFYEAPTPEPEPDIPVAQVFTPVIDDAGVPWCTDHCPAHRAARDDRDLTRCAILDDEPERICEPAVRAMASATSGLAGATWEQGPTGRDELRLRDGTLLVPNGGGGSGAETAVGFVEDRQGLEYIGEMARFVDAAECAATAIVGRPPAGWAPSAMRPRCLTNGNVRVHHATEAGSLRGRNLGAVWIGEALSKEDYSYVLDAVRMPPMLITGPGSGGEWDD